MAFCHRCGARLEKGDRFCGECGAPVRGTGSVAGGRATAARPASAAGTAPVGVGPRFVAQLIDWVPTFVFYFITGYLVAAATGGRSAGGFELEGWPAFLVIVLTLAFSIAYFTLLEARWNGQTLGKRLLRLRVVRADGAPLDLNTVLIRNVLRLVDGFAVYLVGAVFIWTSPRAQRLGDRMAGTVVVRTR